MAQEAIGAVRQAEADAAANIRNAGTRRDEMIAKAREDAAVMKKEVLARAESNSKKALEEAERETEKLIAEKTAEADSEIKALKSKAQAKQAEAQKLIAAGLVS